MREGGDGAQTELLTQDRPDSEPSETKITKTAVTIGIKLKQQDINHDRSRSKISYRKTQVLSKIISV